jgi:hypothetical protein
LLSGDKEKNLLNELKYSKLQEGFAAWRAAKPSFFMEIINNLS